MITVGDDRLELHWAVPASGGVLDIVRIGAAGDTLGSAALRYDAVPVPESVRDSLLEFPEGMGRFYDVSDAELKAEPHQPGYLEGVGLHGPDHVTVHRRAEGRTGRGGLFHFPRRRHRC